MDREVIAGQNLAVNRVHVQSSPERLRAESEPNPAPEMCLLTSSERRVRMLKSPTYIGSGNGGFTCEHCGATVPPVTNGSYRNHCPFCLCSKHVDEAPGDRRSDCRGLMLPIGLTYNGRKGHQIVHQCQVCGAVRRNRVVASGLVPDDLDRLCALLALPT